MWRSLLESLHVFSTKIKNKWDCWESSSQSKRRHLCRIVAIKFWWKMVWQIPWNIKKYLRNVTDLLSDGKTPCERRSGKPCKRTDHSVRFTGCVSPYLCEKPVKNPSIWKESLAWIVPRIRIVPWARGEENLEGWCTGRRPWGERREVICPTERGQFIFPIADRRIKPLGGDQDLRTSTLIREHPIRAEGQRHFLGESEGSHPPPHDSFLDGDEAMNDFRSRTRNFIYRHHVEPRVKLYSPRGESFPLPLSIGVSRTTQTNLDVLQESHIDDYWNIYGSRDLSDLWTGFTQFTLLSEKHPEGQKWSGERLTIGKRRPGQIIHGQSSGEECPRMPSWGRSINGRLKKNEAR